MTAENCGMVARPEFLSQTAKHVSVRLVPCGVGVWPDLCLIDPADGA